MEQWLPMYYRSMAFLMRAFVIASTTMIVIVSISQLYSGEPFTSNWTMFYIVTAPVLTVTWFASKRVQRMGSRSR